jgi:predicted ester cyclase
LVLANQQFTFTGMVFWRIENGKIAERWANIDRLSFMQQLGAIPVPGQNNTDPSNA